MLDLSKMFTQITVAKDELHDLWDETCKEVMRTKDIVIDFLPNLDDIILGLNKKRMSIVTGRTSQGKSSLMLQLAFSAFRQGKKVVYYTFEMNKNECLTRLFIQDQEIDNREMQKGGYYYGAKETESQEKERKLKYLDNLNIKFNDFASKFDNNPNFIIVESFGKTFEEINASINHFIEPDIVFIDYVNMVKQTHFTKRESIDEYIKEIYALCKAKNFHLCVGAQINREAQKSKDGDVKPPEMWNIKESGAIEEICDICMITHWNYIYTRNPAEFNDYLITVKKNRGGMTGEVRCYYKPSSFKFSPATEEQKKRWEAESKK